MKNIFYNNNKMNYLSIGLISSATFYVYHNLLNKLTNENKTNYNHNIFKLEPHDIDNLINGNINKNTIGDLNIIESICVLFNGITNENNHNSNTTIFQIKDNSMVNVGNFIFELVNLEDTSYYRFLVVRNYGHIDSDNKIHKQSQMDYPTIKIKKYFSYSGNILESEQICILIKK